VRSSKIKICLIKTLKPADEICKTIEVIDREDETTTAKHAAKAERPD
jgi:hypothetical protein